VALSCGDDMAHFAQIEDDGLVTAVIVVNNSDLNNLEFPESEPIGIAFCQDILGPETNWRQTSYNKSFRGSYAAIGSYYLANLDMFVEAQPYPSWTLDRATGNWLAPIPMPEVPPLHMAVWDEEGQEWDIVLDKVNV